MGSATAKTPEPSTTLDLRILKSTLLDAVAVSWANYFVSYRYAAEIVAFSKEQIDNFSRPSERLFLTAIPRVVSPIDC